MDQANISITSNQLKIKNPNRIYGLVLLGMGCFLFLIVASRIGGYTEKITNLTNTILDDPELFFDEVTPAQAIEYSATILTGLFLFLASLKALKSVLGGLKRILTFFVPTGVPGPLRNSAKVIKELLNERVLSSFAKPSRLLMVAAKFFTPKLRYCTQTQKAMSEKLISSISGWIWWLAILSIPRFIPVKVMDHVPEDFAWVSNMIGSNWPLPLFLAFIAGFATVVRVFAVLSSIPRVPGVNVYEGKEHLDTTGNPVNYYNHIGKLMNQIRYEDFHNRTMFDKQPVLGKMIKGETNNFSANMMVETQPVPCTTGFAINAVILDIGGAVLLCMGYTTLILLDTNSITTNIFSGGIDIALKILAAFASLSIGAGFMQSGWFLHNTFRFKSDLYQINLKGTYTVSNIGLGDGRGGQFYSERAVVQSDTYVEILATQLVTECEELESDRIIVNSTQDNDFLQRLNHLLKGLTTFQDTGGRLAGVDMTSEGVKDIVSGNVQISALNEAAKHSITESSNKALPNVLGKNLSLPQSENKVCPDCGEEIKAIARKCRFCQFSFVDNSEN